MEATRSSFITKLAIGFSVVLLAAVMIVCIPQGQALADDTVGETPTEHFDTLNASDQVTNAAVRENAPRQASSHKSVYGLLAKNGVIYPCTKKGKKLGKYWKVGSTIKYIFVAANAKKLPGLSDIGFYYKSRYTVYGAVKAKVKKIIFLTKKGKSSVRSIASDAFSGVTTLKAIKGFEKTKVKTISANAFKLTGITKIAFPKTLTKIGEGAFFGTKLKSLRIPSKVTKIGNQAFAKTKNLKGKTINLSKTRLTTIGKLAFAQSNAKVIALPATVKTIGNEAFSQMPYLTGISGLGSTQITTLSKYMFYQSPKVTTVVLPKTCKSIGYAAFYDCTALSTLSLKNTALVSGGSAMLYGTKIDAGEGSIRVPAALLLDYATAPYWSSYRAQLVA